MISSNEVGACAKCGSSNISYLTMELDCDQLCYPYECNDCGDTGNEWYNLEYVETISNEKDNIPYMGSEIADFIDNIYQNHDSDQDRHKELVRLILQLTKDSYNKGRENL